MKTKQILVATLVFLLLFSLTVSAKPIVKADEQYFDINTGLYILKGNVYIEVKNRIITAGQARVNMASLEVWGSGGITVTQDDIYFSGDSVYVYGTQDRASIAGNVALSRTNLKVTSNEVDYNWRDKVATFKGNVSVTQNDVSYTTDIAKYNVETNTFL